MKTLIFGIITVCVMGLAFWAYNQNYQTQAVLKETESLQRDIARLRERVGVLRAEWAYLNRPDRLRDLPDLNFDRLGLFPLGPEQFGDGVDIDFPPLPGDAIVGAVDVRGAQDEVDS
ncbi:MAG: cell division protein FtsL [Rhodobacteraceae bacterium]|nr:cell division protein FtsL [Paracoccaceae bacterium]